MLNEIYGLEKKHFPLKYNVLNSLIASMLVIMFMLVNVKKQNKTKNLPCRRKNQMYVCLYVS